MADIGKQLDDPAFTLGRRGFPMAASGAAQVKVIDTLLDWPDWIPRPSVLGWP